MFGLEMGHGSKMKKAPQVEKLAGPCESWLLDLGANRINSLYRLTDVTMPHKTERARAGW
jgi:hypothetical protein